MAQIVDYSIEDDKATIYLPRKNVVFSGSKEKLCEMKSWFALLASELCGYSLMFPKAWDTNGTQRRYIREKSTMLVLDTSSEIIKVLKKIVFDRTTNGELIINNVYKYNDSGELCGIISFGNFKRFKGKLIPHEVSFSVNNKTKVTFTFTEMWINEPLRDNIFQINIPEETKTLELEELDKKDWLS
jgi:hypothetical protein